jgi:hypothetical protein
MDWDQPKSAGLRHRLLVLVGALPPDAFLDSVSEIVDSIATTK